ncbi:MAG TPA: 50S ribosomal protein L6, partial [Syntrophobacteraceae bacterium]|nr:50S ribosomal protein L6 [Syntrophobacteraceae bacterium]
MSRVGKRPITLPAGVTASLQGQVLTVKGPRGALSRMVHPKVEIVIDAQSILIQRHDDTNTTRGLHGLMRALISNMVVGVSQGFSKSLEIAGVGYRVNLQNNVLSLSLGYSHPVEFALPSGITATIEKQNVIRLEGIENELLGQTAARIRELRAIEPYKGKGIRY